ncbi:MAG: DUF2213 domain-containing protein [bacterium]|nr:DUF2213 domain-containing protein [bacterium]
MRRDAEAHIQDSGAGDTARRWDRGTLKKATTDESTGFLHVDASVTRAPAVFPYLRPDGTIRRELRLPGDVFSSRNLDSIGKATITNDHPPERVTTKNVRRFSVGAGDGNARVDKDHAVVGLVVTDDPTISDMKGGKREVSLGYTVRLEPSSGVFNGEPYDVIQRDHFTNHIAIVTQGRAGPTARAHMDRLDAVQIESTDEPMTNPTPAANPAPTETAGLKVDGLEIQLPTSHARHIAKAFEQMQGKLDAETVLRKKAEKDLAEIKEKEPEKQTLDAAEVQKLVQERAELVDTATKIGGYDEAAIKEITALTNDEIRTRAVADLLGADSVKGKSDDYIQAAFEIAANAVPKKDGAQKLGDAILGSGRVTVQPDALKELNDACSAAVSEADKAWEVK